MILSTIILTFSTVTFIYFGLYVLLLNPNSQKYQNFLYVCLSFAIWSFSYLILNITTDSDFFIYFKKAANVSRVIYIPISLRFCLIFTGYYKKIKSRLVFNISICILPFLFICNIIFNIDATKYYILGVWNILIHIIFHFYNITSIIIFFIWGRLSKLKREKKQSNTIVLGAILTIIIMIIYDIIVDLTGIPNISPSFILIWIFYILFAMVKYQFLAFIPTYVNQDIIDNINESIILLNDKKNIIYANNKTKSILNEQNIENNDISKIIFEHFRINLEIDKLLEGKYKTFTCRIHYLRNNKEKILVDAIFSTAKDKFEDILGILIIGYEIKGLKQLKLFYKTTERESEIIQELSEGYTNKNIANHLGISENTLKRHIANIYIKFGVNNKVELLNLLKDFNLVSNFKADKTLLVLNNE